MSAIEGGPGLEVGMVSTQLGRVERLLSEGHDPGQAQAILHELLRILRKCQNRRAAVLSAAGQGYRPSIRL